MAKHTAFLVEDINSQLYLLLTFTENDVCYYMCEVNCSNNFGVVHDNNGVSLQNIHLNENGFPIGGYLYMYTDASSCKTLPGHLKCFDVCMQDPLCKSYCTISNDKSGTKSANCSLTVLDLDHVKDDEELFTYVIAPYSTSYSLNLTVPSPFPKLHKNPMQNFSWIVDGQERGNSNDLHFEIMKDSPLWEQFLYEGIQVIVIVESLYPYPLSKNTSVIIKGIQSINYGGSITFECRRSYVGVKLI